MFWRRKSLNSGASSIRVSKFSMTAAGTKGLGWNRTHAADAKKSSDKMRILGVRLVFVMSVETGGKKNINRPNWNSFQLKKFPILPDDGFSAFAIRPKIR